MDDSKETKLEKRKNIVDLIQYLLEEPERFDSDYKIEPEII